MLSNGTKKEFLKIKPSLWLLFPASVLDLYLVLWRVAPEKTIVAVRNSLDVFLHLLLPLCLVFLLMVGLNMFLKLPTISKFLGRGTTIEKKLLFALAGIISAGPIYAWYPILKDFREKGAQPSLIAVFLVNRAVKPSLLPMMISFFGWTYVLLLTLLTVGGSLCVGFVVGALLDSPPGRHRNSKA